MDSQISTRREYEFPLPTPETAERVAMIEMARYKGHLGC